MTPQFWYVVMTRCTVGLYVGAAIAAFCGGRQREAILAGLFAVANALIFW